MSTIALSHPVATPRPTRRRPGAARVAAGRGGTRPDGHAPAPIEAATHLSAEERALVTALRRGDEAAFTRLVERYHGQLLRLARSYVRDREVAAEVVQETWIGVLRGIDRFEGRSSLRTWLFRILTNTAKKRGVQEHRSVPFSALLAAGDDDDAVDADRFFPEGHVWAGHWAISPGSWGPAPMESLLAQEAQALIEQAIAELPRVQNQVITLRDVEGWSSEEVCELLELSEGNQRVLLHRARAKVRSVLDEYLAQGEA